MTPFEASVDEYEDVPSPFAKTTTSTRTRANPRSNLFARPMGTVPSEAPVVAEPPRRATLQVDYLGEEPEEEEVEEEEVVEKRPVVRAPRPSAKAKAKGRTLFLTRLGWAVVAILSLRLVFMERGLLQYWQMDGTLAEREAELNRVREENGALRAEIRRIDMDKGYQRQLAKEHLGVIAADEFLILFAGEAPETETATDRRL